MNSADREKAPADADICPFCRRTMIASRMLGGVKACAWCAAGECRVDAEHGMAFSTVAALKQHYQAVHAIMPTEAR